MTQYYNYNTRTYDTVNFCQGNPNASMRNKCGGKCDTCGTKCLNSDTLESESSSSDCNGNMFCIECKACDCNPDTVGDLYKVLYKASKYHGGFTGTFFSFKCKKCGFDPFIHTSIHDQKEGRSVYKQQLYLFLDGSLETATNFDTVLSDTTKYRLIKTGYSKKQLSTR